jgi:diacylglycerol kinase family enzyme
MNPTGISALLLRGALQPASRVAENSHYVLMNPRAGTVIKTGLTPEDLRARFEALGRRVEIDARPATPLEEKLARALASDADVVVAAGGDGTATALAHAIRDSDKCMAVLPLGTANLLARDLHIPLDVDAWFSELPAMLPRSIDVAEVNGRLFLHKVVIGTIPGIAAAREVVRGRGDLRATLGFAGYFLRRLSRARPLAVEITTREGGTRVERLQALAVACNAYDEGPGCFFSRTCLDAGSLTLYQLRRLKLGDLVRLATEMIIGCWRQDEALAIESVEAVTIRSRRRKLKAMIDGEVETLDVPLRFRIRPRALRVLAPAVDEAGVGLAAAADAAASS